MQTSSASLACWRAWRSRSARSQPGAGPEAPGRGRPGPDGLRWSIGRVGARNQGQPCGLQRTQVARTVVVGQRTQSGRSIHQRAQPPGASFSRAFRGAAAPPPPIQPSRPSSQPRLELRPPTHHASPGPRRPANGAAPAARRRVARVLSSNDGTDNDDKPPPPEGTVAPMKHYWLEFLGIACFDQRGRRGAPTGH